MRVLLGMDQVYTIRKATSADIPAIVGLLKKSLGERLMPKTVELWNWKHVDNPFGPSEVLLAEVSGKIIAVRAFMPWVWKKGEKTYRALRAVDTAVDPDYQGEGLFTKLTLQLLEATKELGYQFVFNTPNKQSLPGYLKMGWQEQGRLKIQLIPNSLKKSSIPANLPPMDPGIFVRRAQKAFTLAQGLHSKVTQEFLVWRYLHCPVANYQMLSDDKTYFLLYRIKEGGFFRELRIAAVYGLDQKSPIDRQHLKKELNHIQRAYQVNFTSCLPAGIGGQSLIGKMPALAFGPNFTLRDLTLGDDFPPLMSSKEWAYHLGDLEVF